VQLRHAVGFGALEADDHHDVAVQLAGFEGGVDLLLVRENARGGFDDVAFLGDRGSFDDAAAQIAVQKFQTAGGRKGVFGGAQDSFVAAGFGRRHPPHAAVGIQHGFGGVGFKAGAGDGLHILVQKAGGKQFADQKAHAAGRVEMVHVGAAVGVDSRELRGDVGEIGKIVPGQQNAGGGGHGDEVDGVVGGAAGGVQADNRVGEGALVQHFAERGELVAGGGDLAGAGGGGGGEGVAERGVGVDEGGAGEVQAHDFHHHLVGVGGAVESAGAGAVIGF